MKYTIKKNLHNDFNVLEINKLAARAYAIPYASQKLLRETEVRDERYASDMVTCLSGEWGFKYYKSYHKIPDELNTAKVKFDTVKVPFDWQRTGYEEPVYINSRYPFDEQEPNLPADMSAGIYTKKFNIDDTSKKYIITFLGVANNISLYVNGAFVGYSEISHLTAEFDITSNLVEGENELIVVSFKWCTGTYLECQDFFRENGIFRDVLLTAYGEKYINDYQINTNKTEGGYDLKVDVETGDGETTVKGVLTTAGGRTVAKAEGTKTLDFGVVNVKEWNAEIPEIYYLYLTAFDGKKEVMTVRNVTGFKTIGIDGVVFRFNGAPIKLFGVNHHDTDLYEGYVMSMEDLEKDVKLIKEFNGNAVRTSHYPPDPAFLQFCDIYGIYVVDEADIETHGCADGYGDIGLISKQKKWTSHYVDRCRRMYYRDRNHPCVTMWSLGNESGGYTCHDACYKFFKEEVHSPIPVHYEAVNRTLRFHYDVVSEMYTHPYQIDQMIAGKRPLEFDGKQHPKLAKDYNKYPFFLCEYCHAMGVGPGCLHDYVDRFLKWDGSMGGCIWEWADHVAYHPENDPKYKYKYTYGGDHGEKRHDGHFCVDALVYADRTPHTGAKEMKVAYRPLRVKSLEGNVVTLTNINRFRNTDYIDVRWEQFRNGFKVAEGTVKQAIAAMEEKTFKLALEDTSDDADYFVNFTYTDKATGAVIAVEQVTVKEATAKYYDYGNGEFAVKKTADSLTVEFENGKVVFGGENVSPVSYIRNGKEYFSSIPENAGFHWNILRAFIDNDDDNHYKFRDYNLYNIKSKLDNSLVNVCDNCVSVLNTEILSVGKKAEYLVTAAYRVYSDGTMNVCYTLDALAKDVLTDLPRFGCTFEMAGDFEQVEYYGRGPAENMPDFFVQAPVGIYSDNVTGMTEPYVFPQENGMHCNTRWVKFTSADGKTVKLRGVPSFAFSAHHYTQNELNEAKHQEDLVNKDTTFVTVDGYVRGIGSSSCGPDTLEEYIDRNLENHGFCFDFIAE